MLTYNRNEAIGLKVWHVDRNIVYSVQISTQCIHWKMLS
uniref:Uncharacterized protein n=1 Tax=Arundo donax TaxID=35708 RepID=A0A0A9I2K5_ARUDO